MQTLNIKLFSDGADLKSMIEMAANPKVSGLTTNPSLMHKAGIKDYKKFAHEVLAAIKDKDISFEVFADDLSEMKKQALEIKSWAKNVYVKIPCVNTQGVSTTPLIKELTQAGVKLNITAVFSLEQTWAICQALKGGAPSYISIFAGRIADSGRDPMPVMKAARAMCDETGKQIELLWASTREAQESGCHIITVPPDILKKLSGLGKTAEALTLDTVQAFKKDSEGFTF
jgi:transaldolase